MQNNYDVIVIGAGNGGLSAATTARGGKKHWYLSATTCRVVRPPVLSVVDSSLNPPCMNCVTSAPRNVPVLFANYSINTKPK